MSATVQMGKVMIRPEDGPFKVERHGGRRTDSWRECWSGASAQTARTQYVNESGCMRQGQVRLLAGDGRVLAEDWAPRLRRHW